MTVPLQVINNHKWPRRRQPGHTRPKKKKKLQACGLPTLVTQLNYQREKDPAQVSGLCSILLHLFFLAILSVCTPAELRDEFPTPWSVLCLTSPGHASPAFPPRPLRQCLHLLFTCSPLRTAMPQLSVYGFGHRALAIHHNGSSDSFP